MFEILVAGFPDCTNCCSLAVLLDACVVALPNKSLKSLQEQITSARMRRAIAEERQQNPQEDIAAGGVVPPSDDAAPRNETTDATRREATPAHSVSRDPSRDSQVWSRCN